MKLNKISIIFSLITATVFTTSCDPPAEKNPQAIRDSISEYRKQMDHLNREINRMEEKLADMGEVVPGREAVKVRANKLKTTDFDHYFKINGSVEAVQDATISPETNGQMKKIIVTRGERVTKGQIVAELNTSVIENNIEELKTNLHMAETVYERQRRLWEQEIGSEIQYLEAQNNLRNLQSRLNTLESQLDLAILRAPFRGIVDEFFLKEGELAMPGTPIMQIINLENLYINTDVSERYLPMIKPDDSVILRFPAYPDYENLVPIHRMGNVINPENRTFRLQLQITNPGKRFKPNMVATLSIRSFSAEDVIVIPSFLIKQDVQGYFVFVAQQDPDDNYYAKRIDVERGQESEGRTIIESGLDPGDLIITDGHNKVEDGDLVQVIINQ